MVVYRVSIIGNVDIIAINSIIVGELLGGFALGNKLELNRYELEKFMESPRVKIFTINPVQVETYSFFYSKTQVFKMDRV
jgi:hypothetical protein